LGGLGKDLPEGMGGENGKSKGKAPPLGAGYTPTRGGDAKGAKTKPGNGGPKKKKNRGPKRNPQPRVDIMGDEAEERPSKKKEKKSEVPK